MSDIQMEYENAFDESKELFTPEMESGRWIADKSNQLSVNVKKGLFGNVKKDSDTFKNIKNTLSTLNQILEMKMSSENYDNQSTLTLAYNAYLTLIMECDKYLTDKNGDTRSARTQVGKDRISMINDVKKYAEKDINAIRIQMFLPDDLKGQTLREAIGKARTKTINMLTPDSDHKHVGGSASRLTVLSKDENGGNEGFFSEQKTFDRDETLKDATPFIEQVIKNTKVEKVYCDKVIDFINRSGKKSVSEILSLLLSHKNKQEEFSKYPQSIEFKEELKQVLNATKASYENVYLHNIVNMQSKKMGFNQRNVATSRIASLLNQDKLIAKSQMVQLNDIPNNESRMGSVMDKAKGTETGELISKKTIDMMNKSKTEVKLTDVREKVKGLMKGSFQKDMADMQVIDYLCGQIDRHYKNYFIDTDKEGNFIGAQGIDNDLSFGVSKEKERFREIGTHGRTVMNQNDELTIPHMSRALAINIDLLNESMARYALMDLIAKPELEAFCVRLERLKKAVRKELELGEESKILLDDNQWGEDTLNDFLTAGNVDKTLDNNDGTSNYIGRFYIQHIKYAFDDAKEELKKLKQNR